LLPTERGDDVAHGQPPALLPHHCRLPENHPGGLEKVFRKYVLLLKSWELIGGERLAVDGTKIHGQNARKKNFNVAKLKRHLDRIDDRNEEVMNEFARLDKYEASEEKKNMQASTQGA
jgi:hypothetical protein